MRALLGLLILLPVWLLSAHHYDYSKLAEHPRIYHVKNFLNPSDCAALIEKARPFLETSHVAGMDGQTFLHPGRTSQTAFLSGERTDGLVRSISAKIAQYVGIDLKCAEPMQIARYLPGQEYQAHYDTFSEGSPYLRGAGQRVATFIVYLNTPERGGETYFPRAGVRVQPQRGEALLFYPCRENGQVDPMALHAGCPVIAGEKWIATIWFREFPYE